MPRRIDEVFAFFSDARNLERITPGFLHVRILAPPPITMGEEAVIDYRLSLLGVPFHWRTRIESWEPGRRFVDVQLEGPCRLWRHTHDFLPVERAHSCATRSPTSCRSGRWGASPTPSGSSPPPRPARTMIAVTDETERMTPS